MKETNRVEFKEQLTPELEKEVVAFLNDFSVENDKKTTQKTTEKTTPETTEKTQMKPYTKYKDTGIKWIGDVPEHWETKRFTYLFSFGKGLSITKADLRESGVNVISYGQIHSKINTATSISPEMIRFVDEEYLKTNPQCLLRKNDFVFADTSEDIQGSGNFAFNDTDEPIFAGYHSIIARQKDLECPKYVAYFMTSENYRSQIQSLVNGVKVYSISKNILRKSTILFPPSSEQLSIVRFLEKETANIDTYIKQREQEITALAELKQAEIAAAVTHGLNPNAKMKDSGISWIGEVPEHWEIDKLGQHFVQRKIKVSDKDYPALSVSKMGVTPQLETAVKTDNGDNRKLVKAGNFVVNSRSDRKGSCGFSKLDGSVSLINIVLTPINALSDYYHFLFRSNNYIEEFYRLGRGIVADLWTTRWTEMRSIMIPIPPHEEQQQIVTHIEQRVRQIDDYAAVLKSEIEQMQEYKQRLISDVVTGKIFVGELSEKATASILETVQTSVCANFAHTANVLN
jgi:type I restriction enzyme S subunit